jgi:hypothetical protein
MPVGPVNRKKPGTPIELKVVLTGDRRVAENMILEVRAIAQRFGLEIPNISVTGRSAAGPKAEKSGSNRKSGTRARRSSPSR